MILQKKMLFKFLHLLHKYTFANVKSDDSLVRSETCVLCTQVSKHDISYYIKTHPVATGC